MIADRVKLPLAFDPGPLLADLERVGELEWTPHFNTGVYEGDWSGVSLRSIGGRTDQLYPDPAASEPYADTAMIDRCPALAEALQRFRCELLAVRLLRLAPGALIREHRDYRLGHADGEVRIHVPLTTSPEVDFLLAGVRVDMLPGEAWYLDLNEPHAVANRGPAYRVHLVVDCVVNPWMDAQLGAA